MQKSFGGAILILMLVFLAPMAGAESVIFQSGETQTSLLELYSSEGCSSCPPAEKWLTGLKETPGLWKAFVPVCFHVDYWDYLGWKDDWATAQFTKRQRTAAQYLGLDSVYTPEFLVNGQEWRGWFNGQRSFSLGSSKVGQLQVTMQKPLEFQVQFQPLSAPPHKYRIEVALMGMAMTSRVTAGENKGHTLQHDFAVLSHKTQELTGAGKDLKATLTLPPPRMSAQEYAVAIWVSKKDSLTPVQAVGGAVPIKFVR